MNIFKNALGGILYWLTEGISFILNGLIAVIEFIISLVSGIARGIAALLGAGGCLFLVLMGPYSLFLLFNPVTLLIILFFIIFPILGTSFVSFLMYIKYMVTEFLYDRAESLRKGKKASFNTFNEYGHRYKKMEEEKRRKEQQERQREQQRQWEERFRQWNEYQSSQNNYGGGYYGGGYNGNYGGQTYVNPTTEFKTKFEKSCELLGVSYNADKYQIKLAYRKKAKEYHPDINKASDATKKFQEINDAYEFLNDDNIERYKGLVH